MNGDAKKQAIVDALEAIETRHGKLTPELIVKEASKKTSPLHSEFEWDDKRAAHSFRLEQARGIVRRYSLYVESESGVIVSPRWIRDPDADNDQQGYRSVTSVASDKDRARAALTAEAGRAAAYLTKVRNLAAGLHLESEVDAILESFEAFRAKVAV